MVVFISLKKCGKKKAQMSLEMIIGLIILLVVAAVVIKIFMDKMSGDALEEPTALKLEPYKLSCDKLCQEFIDSGRDPSRAISFCSQYYAIDLNDNGQISGDFYDLDGYGVCEDRTYCFALADCSWGYGAKNKLSPQRCHDLMCEAYTEKMETNTTAAAYIAKKMELGSCDPSSYEDGESLIMWFTNNFENTECMV